MKTAFQHILLNKKPLNKRGFLYKSLINFYIFRDLCYNNDKLGIKGAGRIVSNH